jgi:hypothetical protein
VRRVILWLVVAALFVVAVLYYRLGRSRNDLDVDPNAAREIEKAKRR